MKVRNHLWALTISSIVVVGANGCGESDSCESGQQSLDGVCVPLAAADAGAPDTTAEADSSTTEADGGAMPSGMGDVCSGPEDCAGTEATYCAKKPADETGTCTVEDCDAATNDCPAGYACCHFAISSVPNYCSPQAEYDMLKGMNMCL
jgi:hypothetical protein